MKHVLVCLMLLSILLPVSAQDETRVEAETGRGRFSQDVQPILSEKCYHCHGPDENARQADLRLDTRDGLFAETSEGMAVKPGDPASSEIFQRIITDDLDLRMPPEEAKIHLTKKEIEAIREWIQSGAEWEGLWSLVPPRKTKVPTVERVSWIQNEIDRFILAKLEANRLQPASTEEMTRLVRRVYLDLTGLPPSLEELDAFLEDRSSSAYEKLVDKLLASPGYGEHMAWGWLDAARYADSNGFQGDRERTMWPWRDWVVESLNDGMSFDRFTVEQIAGDLIPDASPNSHLATGFCRNHMINGEGGRIPEENRVEYIFDQIETVSTVWLGMTLNCCRCHDHKYDPLSQKDYYRLFAIFNRTPVNGGGGDPATPPILTVHNRVQQRQMTELEKVLSVQRQEVQNRESRLFQFEKDGSIVPSPATKKLSPELIKILKAAPGSRNSKQLQSLEEFFKGKQVEYVQSLRALRESSDRYNALRSGASRVMVMQDSVKRKTHLLNRGLYNQPGKEVTSGLPEAIHVSTMASTETTTKGSNHPKPSDVNRLELARWLTHRKHPLTARVTVNRIWQHFFGTGFVKTAEDFGSQGAKPSHPRLLDWLAVELMESGWDVKSIQRKIVLSSTYRQSAVVNQRARSLDPNNRWLAYHPRKRLNSWVIRDQALAISGLLVREQGGAPVKPYQPKGVWSEATFNKKRYAQDHGAKLYRRSIYTFWRRIVGPTMLFDVAKRQNCEVKVTQTSSPLHALTTLNDTLFAESARILASEMLSSRQDPLAGLKEAFRRCTSRHPTKSELNILQRRFRKALLDYQNDLDAAKRLLNVGEYAVKEELDPSQHAAMTIVCLMIMNLDETLTR